MWTNCCEILRATKNTGNHKVQVNAKSHSQNYWQEKDREIWQWWWQEHQKWIIAYQSICKIDEAG